MRLRRASSNHHEPHRQSRCGDAHGAFRRGEELRQHRNRACDFATTTQTVALTHHSFVAHAQLSEACTPMLGIARAWFDGGASRSVFACVATRGNATRQRCAERCRTSIRSAWNDIDGGPESKCSCGFPACGRERATALHTASQACLSRYVRCLRGCAITRHRHDPPRIDSSCEDPMKELWSVCESRDQHVCRWCRHRDVRAE